MVYFNSINHRTHYCISYICKVRSRLHYIITIKVETPIIGPVQTKIVASRFSRTLSTLLASGLPLLDALNIVAKVVDNYVVEKGLEDARTQVSEGTALSKPIRELGVFPL